MRLGFVTGCSDPNIQQTIGVIPEVKRLGFDSVWIGAAWGAGVVSCLDFAGACTSKIKQGARIWECLRLKFFGTSKRRRSIPK